MAARFTVKLGNDSRGNFTVLDRESENLLATIGCDDHYTDFVKGVTEERKQEIKNYLGAAQVDAWW